VRTGARRWRARAGARQDEDRAADAYRHATERLASAGYRGYEISNWARPGHESRHNLVYWERRPHEALGPGAHAFDGRSRRWTAARLDGYLAALTPTDGAQPALPPGGHDALDATEAEAERVVLALRLDRGVPAAAARRPPLDGVVPWALEHDLLSVTVDDRLVLTTRGRLLSNEVFARLV
jgi:oxygen-independent coproporphyrinogen-3 oxidase